MLLMCFRRIKLTSGFMERYKNDLSWAKASAFRISSRIPPNQALNAQKSKGQCQHFWSSLKKHRGLLEKVRFHYQFNQVYGLHPPQTTAL